MTTKAMEITLTDGRTLTVRQARSAEMGLYLRAMPALMKLSEVFAVLGPQEAGGVVMPPQALPVVPDEWIEPLGALIARVSGLSGPEYAELEVNDASALLMAFLGLLPAGAFLPPTTKSASPATPPEKG